MNFEIHEFCKPDASKKPKQKLDFEERERQVVGIINRLSRPAKDIVSETRPKSKDPLDFIPNFKLTLEQTLQHIPYKTNKILLQIAWDPLPYFRDHHNLLLYKYPAFIRRNKDPKGLFVYIHCEETQEVKVIHGYCLLDNPFLQEIKQISLTINQY